MNKQPIRRRALPGTALRASPGDQQENFAAVPGLLAAAPIIHNETGAESCPQLLWISLCEVCKQFI